ncbi:MAG TPA: flippase [Patescibacteria group bacterium]|nr:flippase [Patescibacteria group bacterium]
MVKIHNIAKNTSYLTTALVLQKIVSFFYFTLLARFLGPTDLGKFYFAISFTTIFAIVIDLGLANVLIREVAKNQARVGRLIGSILSMKLPLAFIAVLGAVLLINLTDNSPVVKMLVYISCFSMVLDSFTSTFYAAIRGFHNLKYESIAAVIFQLIVLVFGYGSLLLGGGLMFAMGALALASLFNFVYSWFVAKVKIKVPIKFVYDKNLIINIIKIGWPFAAYAVFQRLYTYLDSVLLSFLAGDEQVGLYQVAFKIIFALQFLPLAFTASLYPAMSAYWQSNKQQLSITFKRAINYLTIISIPIIVGIFLLADKIVLIFKDGYGGAVLPLQIIIVSLFFMFLNFPIGSLLNACDRQKKNTFNMVVAAITSIALNLVLIPRFQAVGASIAVLISNGLMFILGVVAVSSVMKYNWLQNILVFFKTLAAAFVMGLLIYFLKPILSILVLIPISAISFFIFLYLFKGFSRLDIDSVFKSFKL